MITTEENETMSQIYYAKIENYSLEELEPLVDHSRNIRLKGMETIASAWSHGAALAYYVNHFGIIELIQQMAVTQPDGTVTIRASKPVSVAKADDGAYLAEGFRRYMALVYATSMEPDQDEEGNVFYTLLDLAGSPVQEPDGDPFVFNEIYQGLSAQIVRPEYANDAGFMTRLQVQLDTSQRKLSAVAKMRAIYERSVELEAQFALENPGKKGNFLAQLVQDKIVQEFTNERGQPIGKQSITDAKYLFESVPQELHDLFAYGAISALDTLKVASQKYNGIVGLYPDYTLEAWIAALQAAVRDDDKITMSTLKAVEKTVKAGLEELANKPMILDGLPKAIVAAVENKVLDLATTQLLKEKANDSELDPGTVYDRAKKIAFLEQEVSEGEPSPDPEKVPIDSVAVRSAIRELKTERKGEGKQSVAPLTSEEQKGHVLDLLALAGEISIDELDEEALKAIALVARVAVEKIGDALTALDARRKFAEANAGLDSEEEEEEEKTEESV